MTIKKNQVESVIDKSMTIHGDLCFKGRIVLSGKVEGTISGDSILVEKTGTIVGKATIIDMECHGRIIGDIHSQTLSIGAKASIKGNIRTDTLVVQPGATLDCIVSKNTQQVDNNVAVVPEDTPQETSLISQAFENDNTTNVFFQGGVHKKILVDLLTDINNDRQIMRVCGENGCGKTFICRALETRLSESHKTIYLSDPVGSIKDILLRIAKALELDINVDSKQTDLLNEIKNIITNKQQKQRQVILLLDEAEKMYPATLEGILKYFSKLYTVNAYHLQIVLFGDSHLNNQMESFKHHFQEELGSHYELFPLTMEETKKYIDYKIEAANLSKYLGTVCNVPMNTVESIHSVSNGIISKIESLTSKALHQAYTSKSPKVLPKHVRSGKIIRSLFSVVYLCIP